MEKYKEAIPEYNQVINKEIILILEEAEWNKSLCYLKMGDKENARQNLEGIINRNGYYKKDAKDNIETFKVFNKVGE